MPAPVAAAAALAVKGHAWRRVRRLLLLTAPPVLAGLMALWLLIWLVLAGLDRDDDQGGATGGGACTLGASAPAGLAALAPEQVGNAQVIVAVGRQMGVPAYGWVIGVATALQESGLRNLSFGDRDSLGLFQQRAGWGTVAERMDPGTAARMFFGGSRGNPGLLQIPGFSSMTLTAAAQAVQRSAFPTAYAKWQPLATQVVASPAVLSATCLDNAAFVGDGTTGARAVAAALRYLGTPYSWGGGGPTGPTEGFGRGAGTVGFDCSGLIQYAWHAAGVTLPRVADQQADAFPAIPVGQPLQAGDLMFFQSPADPPGLYHHAGIADGQGNMVHSPRTGKTVEVVHDVLQNAYYASQFARAVRPVPPHG